MFLRLCKKLYKQLQTVYLVAFMVAIGGTKLQVKLQVLQDSYI